MSNNFTEMFDNLSITPKWKQWVIITLSIVLIASIVFAVFGFNLGADFAGSINLDLDVGYYMSDDNYDDFLQVVSDTLDDMNIKYLSVRKTYRDTDVVGLTVSISNKLGSKRIVPTQSQMDIINKLISAGAEGLEKATVGELKQVRDLLDGSAAVQGIGGLGDDAEVTFESIYQRIDAQKGDGQTFEGVPLTGIRIRANLSQPNSSKVLTNALLALGVAVVVAGAYVTIRYKLSNGIAAALVFIHAILLTVALACIVRIKINIAFVAAVAAVAAYALYEIVMLFARVKEEGKKASLADAEFGDLVEMTVKSGIKRSVIVLGAILAISAVLLIIGNNEMRAFILPVMVGSLAAFCSANVFGASMAVKFNQLFIKSAERRKQRRKDKETKNS